MNEPSGNNSTLQEHYLVKRRVTIVCALLNLFLSIVKVVIGVIGQSQALVADGIHSLSDLASDAMVLVAVRFGSQEADDEHPYGHARFETVATIGLGVLLLLVAAGIATEAFEGIANPNTLLQPGFLALSGAVVSILTKEWMYWYNIRVAKQLNSNLMRANAWHHRSDAFSSIIVLVGIAGTMAGFAYLDAVGAIGVALMIGKIGWDLGWGGVRELVDTGVEPEELERIKTAIRSIDGVQAFHKLRTRRMGDKVLVEAHVLVGNYVTVSEGHMISDRVRAKLLDNFDSISEVLIHIDPEDDAVERPSSNLPGRTEILRTLNENWATLETAARIERINLHYLEGKIDVEVILPMNLAVDAENARAVGDEISDRAKQSEHIGKVAVYFH
ncbi:MAG: cation diffusion facilitator family transporter [Gammaproteobacteria bacterium]|nr:cation diffusion facilitator family transporter [Gammaproteobacteria bacterium]